MGLPNEVNSALIGAANQGGYEIDQSLRFDGSSHLNRTPGSAGTTTTWTFSCWLKLAGTSEGCPISAAESGGYTALFHSVGGEGHFRLSRYVSSNQYAKSTTSRYRDPSAWYHLVTVFDSTNSTASDRIRYYVNGVRLTDFSDDGSSVTNVDPGSSAVSAINSNTAQRIGSQFDGTYAFLQGYMAEAHMLDGTAVTDATDFGGYDNNGVWRPIQVSGVTYGTNGFYLKFDPSATNGIGHDHSGNGNNWTASGFTTSGTGTDVMSDTPTTNWNTLNPLHTESSFTYSNGNLEVQQSTGSGSAATSGGTIAVSSGKWFCEMSAIDKNATNALIGVCTVDGFDGNRQLNESLTGGSGYGYVTNGNTATGSAYGSTWDLYDNMGIALDLDSAQNTVTFYKNGVSQGARNIDNASYVFACSNGQGSSYVTYRTNFGQRDFLMTPGTTTGTDYFNTVTYSGNGSTQSITGVGFQPDLVWIKSTSNSYDHYIADSIRGAYAFLTSNNTGSQNSTTNYDPMSSFDSDGFSVRYTTTGGSTQDYTNTSGASYIAWCWKAGGSSSSNTDGTITSTVSASTAGAFSVCTYTGNGTSGATFGHGLDDTPGFIIVKNRDSGSQEWNIFHSSLGNTKAFNFNSSSANSGTSLWNNTSPTSTVVTVGNDSSTNASGNAFVAYCWAEKAGVTKIGTYTGNETLGGGPEVDCGFRPACVVMKADAGAAWEIHDFKRDANSYLTWSSNSTPTARQNNKVLLTDNGFIIMGNDGNINLNGATIYFIAFAAEHTTDDTYKALNTANLPAPSIKDGSKYVNATTYNGDGGSSQSITGVGHQPDLLWIKQRNSTENHRLVDSVRGVGSGTNETKMLVPNTTDAEGSNSQIASFDTDGWTFNSNDNGINGSGQTYVGWTWKANGAGSSNTDGSITSTVSANPTAGFSIVSYTGNGTSGATVGHGLGVKPSFLIVRRRPTASNWTVYHSSVGATKRLILDLDYAAQTGTGWWNDTEPTSTVFTIGNDGGTNSTTNNTYIAYCFAEVEGYSKFGGFLGGDGVFVYTGFKPALLITKGTVGTRNWNIHDSARNTYNVVDGLIHPNLNNAESAQGSSSFDFLSNGFITRGGNVSGAGDLAIYAAFAENPFGGSGVSPATAR